MAANASRLSSVLQSSPLLYNLLKSRACSTLPSCCFKHSQEAAAGASVMAATATAAAEAVSVAVKAPPVQPSRELAHVRYFIDGSVDAGVHGKLEELLNAYGASPCKVVHDAAEATSSDTMHTNGEEPASSDKEHIDLDDVTHIITMTMQYRDHKEVEARNARVAQEAEATGKHTGTAPGAAGRRGDLIAVVTPLWVTKTCDFRKRQDEQYYSPDPVKIFSGMVICTEGLVAGDSEAVKGIVSALGGQWRGPLVAEVTHLICLNLEGKKAQRVLGSGLRLGMKAVLPHWIDDCVKLHLRVPEDPYLFPDPPVFGQQLHPIPYEQRLLTFFANIGKALPAINNYSSSILDPHVLDGESQKSTRKKMVSPALSSSDPSKLVLTGKSVYVASSCELSPEKLQTFMRKIKEAGGEPLASSTIQENAVLIERADIVVVSYREGWEFWKAYDAGKTIGNLDWLIYVLFSNPEENGAHLPSPPDQMLHWPWPRAVARGFKDTNFTVTGYLGPPRETIKRMIELLGGIFEGTLTKGRTTHLIASVQSGSKVTHASTWEIPIVNHLWIEDCFRRWSAQDVTDPKYLNFDPSFIVGDLQSFAAGRPIDLKDVEHWSQLPEVHNEKQLSLTSLNDAIVDELDEAQEEEELLSSPGPSDRETTPNGTADETMQEDPRYTRPADFDMEVASSPLPSLKDTIAATQYKRARSPYASENPSDASALAQNLVGKPQKSTKKAAQRVAASTPKVRGNARILPDPSLDSASSASEGEVKQEPAEKKRKRDSLAGLGDYGNGFDTSVGYSGRKAAQAATQKLRDTIMPDVMAYEKEKRGGGNKHLEEMFGGRGPNGSAKKPASTSANGRAATQSTSESDTSISPAVSTNGRDKKRGRQQSPPTPHVLTASRAIKGRSGAKAQMQSPVPQYEYSSEQKPKKKPSSLSKVIQAGRKAMVASTGVAISPDQRKVLQKLGAKLLGDNIDGCTHIIVKGISRTVKFLSAIPMGAYFVTEDWVIDSIEAGQLLDEDKYLLKDKEGESKYSMNLAKSLSQARRSKILDDHTLYVTANVQPSFEALKTIGESAGAKVIKRLPTVKQVSDRADVYIISSIPERPTWEHLATQGIPIYSGEAIIKAVMQQQRQFELYTINETEDSS